MSREMIDTGIEWIGKMPKEWTLSTIGHEFIERKEKVSDRDYEALSVTKKGIVKQLETAAKTDDHDNRKKVCKGDFVINSRSDRKQSCGLSEFEGSVSVINIVLEIKNLYSGFAKYLLKNYGFAEEFYRWGSGIVEDLWSTKYDKMKSIMIPIANWDEQIRIANFLDKNILEINNIIDSTNKSIKEYKNYKISLISEVVTRGLDENVEFKSSGISWNKIIPKHWEVINGKRLFVQRKEKAREEDIQLTASQKYGVISQEEFMRLESKKVVLVEKDFSILKHVEPNDFVISMRSFQGGLEYSKLSGCISSAYVMLIPNEQVYSPYFRWLFKSIKYINALQSTSNLVRDGQAMRFSNFVQIPLFIFPKEEQKEIADYLDKKCNDIDRIINEKQRLLFELAEYKKSLVYECVTGKREVK